jgi:signal transduction histidine kinase
MLIALWIVAGLLLASVALGFLVLKRRIAAGAAAKEAAKQVQLARLAAGRVRAELDYVLSQIDQKLAALPADATAAEAAARLGEIRDVLRQALLARREAFPISGPCAEVIDAFRAQANGRDLLYSESGDGRWLEVVADRALVRWAIAELFTNVAHHAGEWSRIAVHAEPADGAIVLTVRDDGGGAVQSVASRLYSPFTPRFRSPGPGLGLYAVRAVIEGSGGRVESGSGPGEGLVHRIRIPHPAAGPYGASTRTPHHAAAQRPLQSQ